MKTITIKPTAQPQYFEIIDAESGDVLGTIEPSNTSDVRVKANGRVANMPIGDALLFVFQDEVQILEI